MSKQNSHGTLPFSAALLLTGVLEVAAQENDPVQELRDRQQRLSNLEYAIKEAELLQQLCRLTPRNPECAAWPVPDLALPEEHQSNYAHNFRLVEVFGSEGRLQAVIADRDGAQRIARRGTELAPGLTVNRIRPDSVEILTPSGVSTLHVGEE